MASGKRTDINVPPGNESGGGSVPSRLPEPELTPEKSRITFHIRNKLTRNALAEFFGTFLLLFLGLSVVAQFVLSKEKLNTWICVNVGWGFTIFITVSSVSKLSGGHLNPAISAMLWTFGKINTGTLLIYIFFQTAGAFFGAWAVYIVYHDAINAYEGGNRTVVGPHATANIFAPYPPKFLSLGGAYIDQMVGTGILGLAVAIITDKRNKIPIWIHPLYFGLALILIGTSFGYNLGYPINPARDFGPRLFTLFIYGSQVFTYPYPTWFLCPLLAPIPGAIAGGWIYHICAGWHIPDDEDETTAKTGTDHA